MNEKFKTLAYLKVIICIVISGIVLSAVGCSSLPSASVTPSLSSTPASSPPSLATPTAAFSSTPNATQIQQTLDVAIQEQVTAAVQATAQAVQTQDQRLTQTAISFAVRATLEMPTHQAATEAAVATATASSIPTFFDVNSNVNEIVRLEIRNNDNSEFLVLEKDANQLWSIVDGTNLREEETDQVKVGGIFSRLQNLTPTDSFDIENLSDFGLDDPHFTFTITIENNQIYSLNIGNQSPVNPRYYAQVDSRMSTVYVLVKDNVDFFVRRIDNPPYQDS